MRPCPGFPASSSRLLLTYRLSTPWAKIRRVLEARDPEQGGCHASPSSRSGDCPRRLPRCHRLRGQGADRLEQVVPGPRGNVRRLGADMRLREVIEEGPGDLPGRRWLLRSERGLLRARPRLSRAGAGAARGSRVAPAPVPDLPVPSRATCGWPCARLRFVPRPPPPPPPPWSPRADRT